MKALVGCEADLVLPGGVDGVARNCVDMMCLAPAASMRAAYEIRYEVLCGACK